jgi:hypothetical protein
MKRLIFIILIQFANQCYSQLRIDTNAVIFKAKVLCTTEYGLQDSVTFLETLNSLTVNIDTFNKLGRGSFFDINCFSLMLIKVTRIVPRDTCEFIIAYDIFGFGKFIKLKGFDSYNSKEVREIYKKLNFKNPPLGSLVNELGHLKYCKSHFRQWFFNKRIPKSCTGILEENSIIRY